MQDEPSSLPHATDKRRRLTLAQGRHDEPGHINLAAIKHVEERGPIGASDTTVAFVSFRSICEECKSNALGYGRDDRGLRAPGEVVHTDGDEVPTPASWVWDTVGIRWARSFETRMSLDSRRTMLPGYSSIIWPVREPPPIHQRRRHRGT